MHKLIILYSLPLFACCAIGIICKLLLLQLLVKLKLNKAIVYKLIFCFNISMYKKQNHIAKNILCIQFKKFEYIAKNIWFKAL